MKRRSFVTVLAAGVLASASSALAQGGAAPDTRPRWGQQAEHEFRLGRGLAPRLMTEDEWKEHQEKMRAMTAEERRKYREEVHERMVDRAKERGLSVPPPRGPGRRPPS
ncbi:MAG: hypothetical protein HYR51_09405 [Candidatus Rokubacteria bacterium]|nr:hypothetical protein [Candidatus Rokubacteria bacterium]